MRHDTDQSHQSKVYRLLLRREKGNKTMSDRMVPAVAVSDGQATGEGYNYRPEEMRTEKSR